MKYIFSLLLVVPCAALGMNQQDGLGDFGLFSKEGFALEEQALSQALHGGIFGSGGDDLQGLGQFGDPNELSFRVGSQSDPLIMPVTVRQVSGLHQLQSQMEAINQKNEELEEKNTALQQRVEFLEANLARTTAIQYLMLMRAPGGQ